MIPRQLKSTLGKSRLGAPSNAWEARLSYNEELNPAYVSGYLLLSFFWDCFFSRGGFPGDQYGRGQPRVDESFRIVDFPKREVVLGRLK